MKAKFEKRTGMPVVLLALIGCSIVWTGPANAQVTLEKGSRNEGFVSLFNGKDLTGWRRVNTAPSTWSVKDGMLICSGKPIGEIRTEKMYQNFVLELEWRHMQPKGNAGVFVWADDITAKGVPFHRSIEVQVLENAYGNTRSHTTHGDIFPIHGARMVPVNGRGGSRAFPTENRSRPSPEWNHYRIECRNGEISLAVNGKVVTRGKECLPRKGYICLESEGGVVHYRNLRIKVLPDTPLEKGMVAVAGRGFRCLYEGIDLSGWEASGEWVASDWRLRYRGKRAGSLSTLKEYGDASFIVDFQSGSQLPKFQFRGAVLDSSEWSKELLAGGKGWNRLEVRCLDSKLQAWLNGQQAVKEMPLAKKRSKWTVLASAPQDFANLYVRE